MEIQDLTETILNYLRKQIITGTLESNKRLNEAEIAKTLKVSKSPVREALRLLENDHFVIRFPRRGVFVAELSSENLDKVYDTRMMIESFAVDILKKKKITVFEKAETALRAATKLKQPTMDDKSEMVNYVMTVSEFHVGLIAAAENDYLTRFYQSITYEMARYQFICLYLGIVSNSLKIHKSILSYLKEGHYGVAKKELLQHINDTWSLIKSKIESDHKD